MDAHPSIGIDIGKREKIRYCFDFYSCLLTDLSDDTLLQARDEGLNAADNDFDLPVQPAPFDPTLIRGQHCGYGAEAAGGGGETARLLQSRRAGLPILQQKILISKIF